MLPASNVDLFPFRVAQLLQCILNTNLHHRPLGAITGLPDTLIKIFTLAFPLEITRVMWIYSSLF